MTDPLVRRLVTGGLPAMAGARELEPADLTARWPLLGGLALGA